MKFVVIIFILINVYSIYPQGEELGWKLAEIFIGIHNLIENQNTQNGILTEKVRFKMSAVGPRWYPTSDEFSDPEIDTQNNFEILFYPSENFEFDLLGNTNQSVHSFGTWLGFNNYCAFPPGYCNEASPQIMDSFVWGLYKISTEIHATLDGEPLPVQERGYFYIDYRDGRYPYLAAPINGHGADTWLKYNATGNPNFGIRSEAPCLDPIGSCPFTADWNNINDGTLLRIWDIKKTGTSNPGLVNTNFFPSYWLNCLAIIPSQIGNHPRLIWGPHPTLTDVVGYRVYRKYGTTNFVPIATTDFDEYYYTDTELTLDFQQGGTNAYYYVKAVVVHESESEATNTVVGNINGQSPEKQINLQNTVYNFQINNYPNPFNPTTTIEYSTPKRSNIIIKVYDMLGREVKELINETKDEGTYQVKFNAESLGSGVYFYTITASNSSEILYRESKQMVLMK